MPRNPFVALALLLWSAPASAWQGPTKVTSGGHAYNPGVFIDSAGHSHVVFSVPQGGDSAQIWEPRYTSDVQGSLDNGKPIGPGLDARFCRASAPASQPKRLTVTCSGYRIRYGTGCEQEGAKGGCADLWVIESNDGGATFGVPYRPAHADDALMRFGNALAHDSAANLHVAYEKNSRIHARLRDLAGAWSDEAPVTPGNLGEEHDPSIAVSGTVVHLTFRARTKGVQDALYYTRWGGSSWAPPAMISAPPSASSGTILSTILSDGGQQLSVVYQHATPEYVTSWVRSSDGGQSWSKPEPVHGTPSFVAAAARDWRGHTFAAWSNDYKFIEAAEHDGDAWLPKAALSTPANSQRAIAVAAGPDLVRVVWHSNGDGGVYAVYTSVQPIPPDPTGAGGAAGGAGASGSGGSSAGSSGAGSSGAGSSGAGGAGAGGAGGAGEAGAGGSAAGAGASGAGAAGAGASGGVGGAGGAVGGQGGGGQSGQAGSGAAGVVAGGAGPGGAGASALAGSAGKASGAGGSGKSGLPATEEAAENEGGCATGRGGGAGWMLVAALVLGRRRFSRARREGAL